MNHLPATRSMYIAYDPMYAHCLPEGHRFPMLKYELIPGQLLHEGTINPNNLHAPEKCPDEVVLITHDSNYVDRLLNQTLTAKEQREIGFPQSRQLTEREWRITQGTINCLIAAQEHGVALNVAGGTHHAFAHRGEGFCLLNDFAVAVNYLLGTGKIKKALIIDLDVHQGNGTASIFQGNKDVFTFSMHGQHNYPFRKEISDLDIGLPDGTSDHEYLTLLKEHLPQLINSFQPDIACYVAGVDILSTDKYGKLNISMEGCKARDSFVFEQLHTFNIPCAVALGGGYSPDIRVIVEAHCNTFREAKRIFNFD
jgi:acetoin utilization deacetylase AcuC-like enzyme